MAKDIKKDLAIRDLGRALGRKIARLERHVRELEVASQAAFRSVEEGAIDWYDQNGVLRERVGKQADGSYGRKTFTGDIPPAPSEPDVVVISDGVVAITWDGRWEERYSHVGWRNVQIHLGDTATFTPDRDTQVGAIFAPRGGTIVAVTESDDDNPVWVRLVGMNDAGETGDPSVGVLVDEEDVDDLDDEDEEQLEWEDGDGHTLTPSDIAAGTVTFNLSHIPEEESLLAWWHPGGIAASAGVPQTRGQDFTVDFEAASVTWPLTGEEAVDDRLRVYYPYYDLGPITALVVGVSSQETSTVVTPAETEVGNLLVAFIAISETRQTVSTTNGWTRWTPDSPDISADTWSSDAGDEVNGMQVWWKVAGTAGAVDGPVVSTTLNPNWSPWHCVSLDGPTSIEAVAYQVYDAPVAAASGPALSNAHLTHWRVYDQDNQPDAFVVPSGVNVHLQETGYRPGLTADYTTELVDLTSSVGIPGPTADWITCAVRFA